MLEPFITMATDTAGTDTFTVCVRPEYDNDAPPQLATFHDIHAAVDLMKSMSAYLIAYDLENSEYVTIHKGGIIARNRVYSAAVYEIAELATSDIAKRNHAAESNGKDMALNKPRTLFKSMTSIFIVVTADAVTTCRNSRELERITSALASAGVTYTVTELESTP